MSLQREHSPVVTIPALGAHPAIILPLLRLTPARTHSPHIIYRQAALLTPLMDNHLPAVVRGLTTPVAPAAPRRV